MVEKDGAPESAEDREARVMARWCEKHPTLAEDTYDDALPNGPGEQEALTLSLAEGGVRLTKADRPARRGHRGRRGADLDAAGRDLDRHVVVRERRRARAALSRPLTAMRRGRGCAGRPRARSRRTAASGASSGSGGGDSGSGPDGSDGPSPAGGHDALRVEVRRRVLRWRWRLWREFPPMPIGAVSGAAS